MKAALLVAAGAVLALATPAAAEDMPVPAPSAPLSIETPERITHEDPFPAVVDTPTLMKHEDPYPAVLGSPVVPPAQETIVPKPAPEVAPLHRRSLPMTGPIDTSLPLLGAVLILDGLALSVGARD